MSFARNSSRTGRSSPSATASNDGLMLRSSSMHETVVDHGDHLAALIRHREADDDEVHAARPPGLLVDFVQRRADLDRVARADRDPEGDVLARVEPGADVDALRDVLRVELVALVAEAEGRVAEEPRPGLDVLPTRLAEGPRERDQLVGRDRAIGRVIELAAEETW